jgi:cell wall-associated NlpC family hydrolase
VGVEVGHFFSEDGRTTVRLGWTQHLAGPLGSNFFGTWMHAAAPLGDLWGLGADLNLFRSGRRGVYLAAGVSGGFGVDAAETFWGSWSAGGGYEFFPLGGLSIAVEARYRVVSVVPQRGAEVSIRIGLDRHSKGKGSSQASYPVVSIPAATALPDSATLAANAEHSGTTAGGAELVAAVVRTATDAMGTPYRWGGNGAGDQGFDCSGLIQYAYGAHGIQLPRTSEQQAVQGIAVDRRVDALRPGDILTFSSHGNGVTHVGLYVGDGRFIHSASQGVQVSWLSSEDPSGRWWWDRWVGARRVVR